jgi:hypothetical protein
MCSTAAQLTPGRREVNGKVTASSAQTVVDSARRLVASSAVPAGNMNQESPMTERSPSPPDDAPPTEAPARSRRERIKTAALLAILLLGLAVFVFTSNFYYPLRQWTVFVLAGHWMLATLFATACLSTGLRLLRLILPTPPVLGERLALGFALGVLVFALGVFLAGLAGLFGHVFFFVWPGLMILLGARSGWRELRRTFRHLRRFGARLVLPRTPIEAGAALLLVLGLIAVYLLVMTPLNVGGDAYWYHLPIAEHYAIHGTIRPYREGWYLAAYPQLASLLYTWAFQSPGSLYHHVALSSHLEWTLFLATLAGVSTLARRLLGGTRVVYGAAVVFLFPGLFLYDSSLITGADHVLAFWAPALGLALIRLGKRFELREALLAGLFTAGALLTKYQGILLLTPATLLVLGLWLRNRRTRPVLVWGTTILVVTSAHWLKNLLFYGDPFYPLLHAYLPDTPFHPGAGVLLAREYWNSQFIMKGTFWQNLLDTLLVLPTFSFIPHDWGFHGHRAVFGSLFTLLIPVLLFLRGRRRLWLLIAGIYAGMVVWFVTSHQDRFLQALLPWMAACTVAMLVLAWQRERLVRLGVAALVLFQLIDGADVYFIRTHNMVGDSALKELINFVSAGQRQEYADRWRLHSGSLQSVGKLVPPEAVVLLHERHDRLGLNRKSISDTAGWQGAIDYLLLDTPVEVAAAWRRLGITHAMWWADRGGMSPEELAREAVFIRAIEQWGDEPKELDEKRLSALGSHPRNGARAEQATRMAWLGCGGDPKLGIYSPSGLVKREPARKLREDRVHKDALQELDPANILILRPSCGYLDGVEPQIEQQWKRMVKAGDVSLWVRR